MRIDVHVTAASSAVKSTATSAPGKLCDIEPRVAACPEHPSRQIWPPPQGVLDLVGEWTRARDRNRPAH